MKTLTISINITIIIIGTYFCCVSEFPISLVWGMFALIGAGLIAKI